MKTFKKTIAVVLCVIMMLGIAPLNELAEIDLPELHLPSLSLHLPKIDFKLPEIHLNLPNISLPDFSSMFVTLASAESGTCGNNLSWEYDSSTYTLTIDGTGEMTNYDYRNDLTTAPWRYNRIETVVICDGVTKIGEYAFYGCSNIKSITIPVSVTNIGVYAFVGCNQLKTAGPIGGGYDYEYGWVSNIPSYAFLSLESLTSIEFDDSISGIGTSAFNNCSALIEALIPDSVTSIGSGAFSGCTNLRTVILSASLTKIDSQVFKDCSSITSIIIPDNVRTINNSAFNGCSNLTEVIIGENVTSLGSGAFKNCAQIKNIEIPENMNTIYSSVFSGCSSILEMSIPESVTSIGSDALPPNAVIFYAGNATGSPWGAKKVYSFIDGNLAFTNANKTEILYCLKTAIDVSIPDSVRIINTSVFTNCTNLTSLFIPENVVEIGSGAFSNCSSLTSITVSKNNMVYHSIGNCLIATEEKSLICGCKNSIIPDDGSVTTISSLAFGGCVGLTSVTIPDSITNIGSSAFSRCTGLTSVIIPDSVTSIGYSAFYNCSELTSLTIGASVTSIGSSAFYDCTDLTEINYNAVNVDNLTDSSNVFYNAGKTGEGITVTFGNSVEKIPEYLFYASYLTNRPKIISAIIGENITSISSYAFYNCIELTSITIPDSVTSIGYRAFYNCTGLTSISIPNSVTNISSYAFYHCIGLTSLTIGNSVTSIGGSAFNGCTGLTSITISDSVTSIDSGAFEDCTGLTSVTIGNSVTSIGSSAFDGCIGLASITIPDSVTSIGYSAFENCPLEYVKMGSGLTEIPSSLINKDSLKTFIIGKNVKEVGGFSGCTNLTSINIPNGVTIINYRAFYNCTGLTSIAIPNSVTRIDYQAFYNCTGLTSVTIGNSVTSIGYNAFQGCTGLTSINIPDSVIYLDDYAFSGCTGLTNITIPESVTSIGSYAFSGCTELKSIIIPDSVTSIGSYAFSGCTGLKSIIIPDSVTSIGSYAFSGCTGLKSITIGNSVTDIGSCAFNGCTGLTSVTIPDSVTNIGGAVFAGCSNLTDISLPFIGNAADSSDKDAILGSIFSQSLLNSSEATYQGYSNCYCFIPRSLRKITVTNATKIPKNAFYNCSFLTEINLPNSVTSLEINAFYGCTGLTNITIPESVKNIGGSAFSGCTGLTSITIPDSVTSIGYNAFENCPLEYVKMGSGLTEIPSTLINKDSLKTFIIGENVTTVGGFSGCKELTSITIPDSVTSIEYNAFENCPLEYVKMGSGLTEIPSTLINKDSLKTFIIGKNVTTVGGFSDCKGLTSITIPDKVKTINSSAFSGCTGLKSITIPNSVTSIGSSAFSGCTNLATITLPDNITKIGYNAFYNTAYYNNASNWSDNMLYIGKHLIRGKTDLAGNKSVKSGTTCIADSAFYGCDKIITLTVPTSVKYIGSSAFYNVTNVAYTGTAAGSPWGARCLNGYTDGNFVYSDSGKAKLVACSGLATGSVVIPASTDTIGNNAFSACSTITNIYIPVNVTRIGNSAFSGTALSDVYYEGSTVDKLGISFGDNNSRITDATWHYNSKKSDMPQATVYTLTYNANGGSGAPSKQTGNGSVTISNTKPTRSGYTFLGWATTASATSAQYGAGSLINLDKNITLYAVWQKGNTPGNPDNPSTDIPEANIIKGNAANNQKTYDYRTTVTFTANVPSGGKVQWYIDGKKAGTDSTLTVKDSKESYTVKVVVTDKNGNQTMDEEEVTIKNGFFDKLIWFFVHLFNPGAYDIKQ